MAKSGANKSKAKRPKKVANAPAKPRKASRELDARLTRIEEALEQAAHRDFYNSHSGAAGHECIEEALEQAAHRDFYNSHSGAAGHEFMALVDAKDRFVRATSDGWLLVLSGGSKISLPSGVQVLLTKTAGGRDYSVVAEGALAGTNFDVISGNLESTYKRLDEFVLKVGARAGGPVIVGGVAYDLELSMTYKDGGVSKSSGPFPAMTDPTNPLPQGTHDIEIADFPHDLGAQYGALGKVWFRIGHTGEGYLHPGRVSEGCMTCAPGNWPTIYKVVHAARLNNSRSAN